MTIWLSRWESALLLGAIVSYFAAMLLLWGHLFLRRDEAANFGSPMPKPRGFGLASGGDVLLLSGGVLHALALMGQGSALFALRAGVAGFFGWALVAAYLAFGRKLGRESLGAMVTPVALVAALFSLSAPPLHHVPTPQSLQTPYWVMHVLLIVVAYVALAFAFGASLLYLLQESLLKRKQLGALWQKLPSLHIADEWISRTTAFGLGMLTLGLCTGLMWSLHHPPAQLVLHDPKVLVSGALWLTFAVSLAARRLLGWSGRRSNLVVVGGFVLLVVSFFVTPHWLNVRS